MLSPRKTKYSKNFARKRIRTKIKQKLIKFTACYSIFLLESGKITSHQIEALRKYLRRYLKKNAKLWLKIYPCSMLTQQAKQTRMGKGKGSISLWFYASSAGSCLFEISSINKRSIQLLFQNFSKKYSMNSTIMQKNK